VKIYTDDIDPSAYRQFIHSHVAAMPDVYAGIGAAVGSVIPTKGAIIPAAVGVDIGCDMNALCLSINAAQLPDNLGQIRTAIETAIPVGFDAHSSNAVERSTLKPSLAKA